MGDHPLIGEVRTLGQADDDAAAKATLEKIAWQVQPIMRKHGWKVGLLTEFMPKNGGLLGLNVGAGATIKVRLRDASGSFLPYHSAMGTMLHELCHNQHGAHSVEFYTLLDALQDECDALLSKCVGFAGSGFDAPGRALSTAAHNPARGGDGRQRGLAAAEKRRARSGLQSGGQRLGGAAARASASPRELPAWASASPRELAAWAAERRAGDASSCGSLAGAAADDAAPAAAAPAPPAARASASAQRAAKRPLPAPQSSGGRDAGGDTWACAACTLLNGDRELCSACGTSRAAGANKPAPTGLSAGDAIVL